LAKRINLSPERIDILERAAILHDIGKIGIEEYLLKKNKRLSRSEIFSLRKHPLIGMKILEPLDFLRVESTCIGQHHERVDGRGYPFGIPGDGLLMESRILAIADAFDAMTSDRPYRKALSREDALGELIDNAGRQHDSDLVNEFIILVESGVFDALVTGSISDVPASAYGIKAIC
jgi:HD-GYP domain-containing protein (c-di-GMP phosphodiesterase class II)